MFLRPFLALMGLLCFHCVLAQPCQNIPGITATDTGLCLGESTTLSLDYTLPTMCDMNITPNPAPLGSAIPGFTYGGVHNGYLYYVYNSFTSWTQGELICRQSGGYLTCINDIFENSFVSKPISGLTVTTIMRQSLEKPTSRILLLKQGCTL